MKPRGRPRYPPMTDAEHEATAAVGSRRAAWEISRMRGGVTNPDRRVSDGWVREQRRARLDRQFREENPTAQKSGFELQRLLRSKAAGARSNPVMLDTRDPEHHQDGEILPPADRNTTPEQSFTGPVNEAAGTATDQVETSRGPGA